jgi:hypothetical protein
MIRKFIATAALAATAMIGLAGTASAATPRHSDYVVNVGGTWVTEDTLTPSDLAWLASQCGAPTFGIVQMRTFPALGAVSVVIPLTSASVALRNVANADQVGLAVPSFIGPDHSC